MATNGERRDSRNIETIMTLGKKSGPPPKRGPNPQGLNIKNNTVKTVKLEKLNGNRQSVTQRGKKRS